jgi:hypothetical protein
LLVLEVTLRICGPEYHRFTHQPVFYSNPRGYFDVVGQDGKYTLYGVRDQYWPDGLLPQRVPDELRSTDDLQAFLSRDTQVLGLGDSFTFGRGVRYEDTYLRRLEKQLAQNGRPLRINNIGYVAYSLQDIATAYMIETRERDFPLVIYGFVLNDFGLPGIDEIVGSDYIDIDNGGVRYRPYRAYSAAANFVAHCVEKIRLDRVTRQAYLDAFEGDQAREQFELLAALNGQVQADGGQLVIVLFPLLYEFHDYPFQGIHDKISAFCRRRQIPLLDLLPAFAHHRAQDLWVHPTDHHPNEIAHEIAAREIYAFLRREGILDGLPSAMRP